jgi:NlpC/P60 family
MHPPFGSRLHTLKLLSAATVAAVSAACASSGATPRPFPTPGDRRPVGERRTPDNHPAYIDRYALVGTALELRGTPYRDGGADASGFDCSGFTRFVFARHGLSLPRAVQDQFATGRALRLKDIAPGDLVFFTTQAPGASHVGIAVGGDRFVHAPSSNGVVRVEQFSSAYWRRRVVGFRRVIADDD